MQAGGETCVVRSIYSLPFITLISFPPIQLDIMDTAGAEQFTALNEVYIKVPLVSSSKDHPAYPIQKARGFVLVFR